MKTKPKHTIKALAYAVRRKQRRYDTAKAAWWAAVRELDKAKDALRRAKP